MAKKDWIEIIEKFNKKDKNFIINFLNSDASFCPSEDFLNIFDNNSNNNFNSNNLNKSKPANWIPIYKKEDLSNLHSAPPLFYFLNNLLYP